MYKPVPGVQPSWANFLQSKHCTHFSLPLHLSIQTIRKLSSSSDSSVSVGLLFFFFPCFLICFFWTEKDWWSSLNFGVQYPTLGFSLFPSSLSLTAFFYVSIKGNVADSVWLGNSSHWCSLTDFLCSFFKDLCWDSPSCLPDPLPRHARKKVQKLILRTQHIHKR